MGRWRTVALGLAGWALLAGCEGAPPVGVPDVPVARADRDLLGPWSDARGVPLPDGTAAANGILVVATSYGSTTCTRRNGTVFMHLTWPVGRRVDVFAGESGPDNVLELVRDSTGSGMEIQTPSDLAATQPATARPTGFHRDGNTISVDPATRAVYVVRADGRTERWARLAPAQGCA